jgi:hypothetical protein
VTLWSDFTFRGLIPWSGDQNNPAEHWNGYTVFQVKHHKQLAHEGSRDARWLLDEIKKELDQWADREGNRPVVPDYVVFVSNVALTAASGTGGYDKVMKGITDHLAEYDGDRRSRIAKLRAWTVWDGNKIEGLIDAYPEVKWSFNGLLTAADVLGALNQFTQGLPLQQLEPALRDHVRQSLMEDRYVYFDEAGGDVTSKTLLSDIAIDLPVSAEDTGKRTMILRHVISHGDHVLRLKEPLVPERRHIILTGSPGNGKTTLSKFLAQVYRAVFHDAATLVGDHQTVAQATLAALARAGATPPTNRRWPVRIDLAAYSEKTSQAEDASLLRWIANEVTAKSASASVTAYNMHSWLSQWPWLFILDGLDEVTAVEPRRKLITEVEKFVAEADQYNADLLVVLTSRPTGLDEEIAPQHFRKFALGQFTLAQALAYGKLAADARLAGQVERRRMVHSRLDAASRDETLKHLMKTPLQVLIMSIILESSGTLPPDRYGLFDGYYDTVYKRETNKANALAKRLADHRTHVDRIHNRVGFELHVDSEQADGLVGEMSSWRLEQIVEDELGQHGFDVTGAEAAIVCDLVDAARMRLVLLVPHNEGLGFEVRSLQELMAARHLATGDDEKILERLREAAPSPHWRNTWIFTAGRIFKIGQDHQRAALVDLVNKLDVDVAKRLGRVCGIAPQLALDLVDDGLARMYPTLETDLLRIGTKILSGPPPQTVLEVARAFVRAADRSKRLRAVIRNAIRAALSTTAAETSRLVQSRIRTAAKELAASTDVASLGLVMPATAAAGPPRPNEAFWASFKDEGMAIVSDSAASVNPLMEQALSELLALRGGTPSNLDATAEALADTDTAVALELLLEGLTPADWNVTHTIRDVLLARLWRVPVGARLS